MKNTDMKVIAIILTVALCLTVLTSNVVSIASVVILAKGSTGATVEAGTNAGTSTDVNAPAGNAGTQTQTPAGNSGSTTPTQAPSGNTGATQAPSGNTGATQAPSGNTGATQAPAATGNLSKDEALAMYQKAAKDIHDNGTAGYNKIGWQKPLKIEGLGILDSVIVPILEKFMTTEDEAKVQENAKGSDDAKNRMPISNCTAGAVKSATGEKLANGNYKIVIVLNEQTNPSYADTDGLAAMSREFLDYKDVEKEAKNIAIVKSLEGQIVYKDYTITSEMTADGKFVSITHCGIGYIKANLNGSINATGELEFNAKYTDFKY